MNLQSSVATGIKRCASLMSTFIPNALFFSATALRTLSISGVVGALSSSLTRMARFTCTLCVPSKSSRTVKSPVSFEPDFTYANDAKTKLSPYACRASSVILIACPSSRIAPTYRAPPLPSSWRMHNCLCPYQPSEPPKCAIPDVFAQAVSTFSFWCKPLGLLGV